jgi:hypothetical protein
MDRVIRTPEERREIIQYLVDRIVALEAAEDVLHWPMKARHVNTRTPTPARRADPRLSTLSRYEADLRYRREASSGFERAMIEQQLKVFEGATYGPDHSLPGTRYEAPVPVVRHLPSTRVAPVLAQGQARPTAAGFACGPFPGYHIGRDPGRSSEHERQADPAPPIV